MHKLMALGGLKPLAANALYQVYNQLLQDTPYLWHLPVRQG